MTAVIVLTDRQRLALLHECMQVKRNLLEPSPPAGLHGRRTPDFYALSVLYYAGHGDKPDGRFCVEKSETVTLDDILAVWAASAPYKAGGSRLFIVADSCFAGRMAVCASAPSARAPGSRACARPRPRARWRSRRRAGRMRWPTTAASRAAT
jgi:hypothetical protein